jgi:hypothetical protein
MLTPWALFQCFSSCVREKTTCAWGFHEHSTIATEGIKLESTGVNKGPSRGSSGRRPQSKDPHWRQQNLEKSQLIFKVQV